MKRSTIAVAVAAVLCGPVAAAGPKPLSDAALDLITAGGVENALQGSGGAIVGNNSEATLLLTGTLDLSEEAQSGATALNLVNSSESTVANGVNVWDGKLPDGATPGATGQFQVEQKNVVQQEQRRVALLPAYERTGANESSTWTEDSTHTSASTLATTSETRAIESSSSTRSLTSSGSVDTQTTVVGQTIQGGRGLAGAGDLAVGFDGGEIKFVANASVDNELLSGELRLTIELPEFSIDFAGGGCAVQMGSCTGEGSLDETEETLSDHSVLETHDSSEEVSETFVGGGSSEIRSPFHMADAQAEYIVIDDSTLDVESNYGITLAGSAQSNLRAMNAVNAAGSAVANAVNVSRTPSLTATASLALVQQNVIGHSR
ncbi:MAG TPA: hypothetical protein VF339_16970 [Gammaproteobacteria bacterium]